MQKQEAEKKHKDKDKDKDKDKGKEKRRTRFSSIGKMFGKHKEKEVQRCECPLTFLSKAKPIFEIIGLWVFFQCLSGRQRPLDRTRPRRKTNSILKRARSSWWT